MGEFGHIVGFVEFARVDLVDSIGADLMLGSIILLNKDLSVVQVFHDPSTNEGFLGIFQPDISLSGEIVLSLDCFHTWLAISLVRRFDELWGEGVRIIAAIGS
jgi:hypothetical protein